MVDHKWVLLAAVDQGKGIGYHGQLPWHYPADLRHFKNVTRHQVVVVGIRTFESMPVLQDRYVYVVGRDEARVGVAREANRFATRMGADKVILAGGAATYHKYHMLCDEAYITRIPGFHTCDTFFNESWLDGMKLRSATKVGDLDVEHYTTD